MNYKLVNRYQVRPCDGYGAAFSSYRKTLEIIEISK